MQNLCILDHLFLHIILAQENICSRLTHKCKGTLTALIQSNKCKCRHRLIGKLRTQQLHAIFLQRSLQKLSKIIISEFTKERGLKTVARDRDAGICRCSARVAHITPLFFSRCKINQRFSHTNNIHDSSSIICF